mmetsp:Transcript_7799/g.18847  ORF Transcript_7799/g.18847 Transcript_7799/m.18847 type:complete len:410 (+) Transcript_7799:298-1527(+)|eukprot:CAMPEP_0178984386 /NCGR_PEP_ID=MMETSP0795-20121207/1574_1 /TAXON_ID=88552 /ORGANISM="Amoebophrya sp., Strain Ameob2" /LENGTH=409 /DNA_ID=CAMNT_0020675239 /DNA_START=295 /DNA_END=1524 /DNA_ORIENTATION=-
MTRRSLLLAIFSGGEFCRTGVIESAEALALAIKSKTNSRQVWPTKRNAPEKADPVEEVENDLEDDALEVDAGEQVGPATHLLAEGDQALATAAAPSSSDVLDQGATRAKAVSTLEQEKVKEKHAQEETESQSQTVGKNQEGRKVGEKLVKEEDFYSKDKLVNYDSSYPDHNRMVWCVVFVDEFEDAQGQQHAGRYIRWPKYKKSSCAESLVYGPSPAPNWSFMTVPQIMDYRKSKKMPIRGLAIALLLGILIGSIIGYWFLIRRRNQAPGASSSKRPRASAAGGADDGFESEVSSIDESLSRERPRKKDGLAATDDEGEPATVTIVGQNTNVLSSGHVTPGGKTGKPVSGFSLTVSEKAPDSEEERRAMGIGKSETVKPLTGFGRGSKEKKSRGSQKSAGGGDDLTKER